MRLLIFCLIIFVVSCYKDNSKEVDDGVYARVGPVELTQEDLVFFDNKTPDLRTLNSEIKIWIDETLLFSEAMKNGFKNDVVLQRKRDSYYRELIITSFVESVIASKVSVSNDDVRLYYKRNKGEFTRVLDEVRIEQYIVKSKRVADRLVASFNSKKNIDLSKFDIELVKTETVQRGTFAKNIDDMLFVKRKGVVGPVVLGKDISVLKVLNINKEALYFSRAPIPHLKDLKKQDWLNHHTFFKHIGIYGFRTAILKEISQLPSSILEQKEEGGEMKMLPDEKMEEQFVDFVIDEALSEKEESMLMEQLEANPELSMIFDKVIEKASEFTGAGEVEGPGTGTSDSIPARLSDGEFVFTAKSVEQIGADNLMKMMKDAEAAYDAGEDREKMQEGGLQEMSMDMERDMPNKKEVEVTYNVNRPETVSTVQPLLAREQEEDLITQKLKEDMLGPSKMR